MREAGCSVAASSADAPLEDKNVPLVLPMIGIGPRIKLHGVADGFSAWLLSTPTPDTVVVLMRPAHQNLSLTRGIEQYCIEDTWSCPIFVKDSLTSKTINSCTARALLATVHIVPRSDTPTTRSSMSSKAAKTFLTTSIRGGVTACRLALICQLANSGLL